ncbi:hypothetical protein BDV93DRAFT_520998 [Ceratobasidium sp. AG-I]|nr:hypothetical protein BDV93DRAFT_520998 [Ceratobasidium sp. AG-I]
MVGGVGMGGESQLEACDRPIAAWNIVWGVKAFLTMLVAWWEYRRAVRPSVDQILAVEQARLRRESRRARRERGRPSIGGARESGMRPSVDRSGSDSPIIWTRGAAREADLDVIDAAMRGTPRSLRIVNRMHEIRNRREREERWYSRCSTFQALYGLIWFIAAQILLYGSFNTCRWTSPYVWWLGFGLLCLGYIVVAEMLAVAIVVFVLGPLVYLTINLILVCLGRHPMQPGGRMAHINPDVPKMSKTLVDRIPLVMYIPVPVLPSASTADKDKDGKEEHVYPPAALPSPPPAKLKDTDKEPSTAPTRPRRRFFFFRRRKAKTAPGKDGGKEGKEGSGDGDVDLEAGWERNEYPFVKLEANRAACAICLMDFEPPRRVGGKGKDKDEDEVKEENGSMEKKEGMEIEEEKVGGSGGGGGEDENKGEEAGNGEGAEPLRLLACGHVFHRECLDPWLVDVSGRCPTCQRPVEEDDLEPEEGGDKKKKKKSRR